MPDFNFLSFLSFDFIGYACISPLRKTVKAAAAEAAGGAGAACGEHSSPHASSGGAPLGGGRDGEMAHAADRM